jgi:hypothetical protein
MQITQLLRTVASGTGALAFLVGGLACESSEETTATPAAETGGGEMETGEMETAAAPAEPGMETGTTESSWAEWDADDDEILTENETIGGFERLTVDWDNDGDAAISNVEMSEGLFEAWDTDEDGRLEVSEFEEGAELWFGDRWDYAGFTDWDGDGDGELTLEEYNRGFDDLAVYDDLDENDDQQLTANEIAVSYYASWDTDGDGEVEVAEWAWY